MSVNSTIVASNISITANNTSIDASSILSANGTGFYDASSQLINGGYAGDSCAITTKKSRSTNMWTPKSFGLGGNCSCNKGGGLVQIVTANFSFSGQISAAGNIAAELKGISDCNEGSCSNGGSGGSVFLNYTTLTTLGASSLITVAGGPYAINSGGGGGGRVALYGGTSYTGRVILSGGTSSPNSLSKCPNGGSGTLYIDSMKSLIVNNEGIVTQNPTIISSDSAVELRVLNKALVIPDVANGTLSFSSVMLNEGQMVPNSKIMDVDYNLVINAGSLKLLESSLIGSSDLQKLTITLTEDIEVDASSVMYFLRQMQVNANNCLINGDLRGYISLLQPSLMLMNARNAVVMSSESSIKADRIVVFANSTQISGNLHSPDPVCTGEILPRALSQPPFNCKDDRLTPNLLPPPVSMVTTFNFTVYIYGNNLVSVQNTGRIAGARIGMCSAQVQVDGVISAVGAGCSSNEGPGKGYSANDACSGTGGGFGGAGGRGKKFDSKVCKLGETYSSDIAPWYEGSGGGSPTSSGGEGGGYIQIESVNMTINGIVTADGEDAILNDSGGGSGGGVFLKLRSLTGTGGQIRANGHRGNLGGGGGGGGRILISWLGSTVEANSSLNYTNTLNNTDDWKGLILASGGTGSSGGETGQDGTVTSVSCQPGYYGYLCEPCPKGKYSDDLSSTSCAACKHIDSDADYTEEAETSSECAFDCPTSYTKDTSERKCYSPVNEFMRIFGGQGYLTIYMFFVTCSTGLAALFFYYLYRRKRKNSIPKFRSGQLYRSHINTKTRKVPM
jgi:hypothetical protein